MLINLCWKYYVGDIANYMNVMVTSLHFALTFKFFKLTLFSNKLERGRKKKRTDSRELRQENSDKVWNELAVFKTENRSLVVEK